MTGYLYANKTEFKSKRIIALLITYILYSVLSTIVLAIFAPDSVNGINKIVKSDFPILARKTWYFACYIVVFFMVPYINLFLQRIDNKVLLRLCVTLFFFLSFLSGTNIVDFFGIKGGYSAIWLLSCYILDVAIRRMDIKISKTVKWASFFICFALLMGIRGIIYFVFGAAKDYYLAYNSPFIVVMSIAAFLLIIECKIGNSKAKKAMQFFCRCGF